MTASTGAPAGNDMFSEEEVAVFGAKVCAFAQTLSAPEQQLLRWLIARAEAAEAGEADTSGFVNGADGGCTPPPPGPRTFTFAPLFRSFSGAGGAIKI